MLEGILSFFIAAAIVSSFGDGSSGDPRQAPAIVFLALVLLRIGHALWTRRIIAILRRPLPGMPPFVVRTWPMSALHAAAFYALLEWGGWAAFIRGVPWANTSAVVRDICLMMPWLLIFASWQWSRQTLHVEIRHRPWSKAAFILFHFRALLIPVTPFLLNDILTDVVKRFPIADEWLRHFPSLGLLASLVILALVFSMSPFIIRLGLPMQSMNDGPLRRRFEATAQAAGFRYLDILVCKTEGNIINAAFLGVLGRLRYVVMTDGILQSLKEDDLVGVFAHEMGHSHRRHLILSNALVVGFLLMTHVISLGTIGLPVLGPATGGFIFAGALAAFLLFVFSPIAKRFETEADVYAGEILRDPQPITRSLCALGDMFPHLRTRGGFVHPSIETRVAFLGEYFKNADLKTAFLREMRRVRKTIYFFLGAAVLVWVLQLPAEWRAGRWAMNITRAFVARDAAAAERLLPALEKDIADGVVDDRTFLLRTELWQTLVGAAQDRGDYAAAEPYLATILSHEDDAKSPVQRYNAKSLQIQQAAGTGDWTTLRAGAPIAAERLKSLTDLFGPEDPEMVREVRDVRTFLAALWLLEAAGEIIPTGDPIPWPELPPGDGPDFVRTLRRIQDRGEAPDQGVLAEARRAGGDSAWRRDFLARLAESLRLRATRSDGVPAPR